MNTSKVIISLLRRSYGTRYGTQRRWKRHSNPGVQQRLDKLEDEPENNFESVENIDLDNVEPDFMQVHDSYTSHKKELTKATDTLKLRIVTRKYFKENEPNLLTYMEKEQIRFLNTNDPVEYTPEKLSESFPAVPRIIRKVLKAKWHPKSVDKVLKHDQQVIENWKKFKRGELPLESHLREHLAKFKGRMISLPNREELEKKLVLPERTFVKPKSQFYSGIIQSYLDQKATNVASNEETSICVHEKSNLDRRDGLDVEYSDQNDLMESRSRSTKDKNKLIPMDRYGNEIVLIGEKESSTKTKTKGAQHGKNDVVTLDEFFKHSVENIDGEPSIEQKVLIDTYKKKMESIMAEKRNSRKDDRSSPQNSDAALQESDSVTLLTDKDLQTVVEDRKKLESIKHVDNIKEFGLETYVKVWEKKASQSDHYPETIKIPKDKYKKGKLYQLRDCYYDHDGEFLYRVPGLSN